MNVPFSSAQFFDVFARYNEGVWPLQLILLALAVLIVATAVGAHRRSGIVFGALAALWVWMALAYHVRFFSEVTPAAFAFAALFLLEAAAIAWHGVKTKRLRLTDSPDSISGAVGWLLVLYALVAYPAIGYLLGQRYPKMPTFGLPCPTTILTFGILSWAVRPLPWAVLVVPVVWSVVATSAAINFGIGEDFALLPAAILVVGSMWWRGKTNTLGTAIWRDTKPVVTAEVAE
jgi:hypothetical protein